MTHCICSRFTKLKTVYMYICEIRIKVIGTGSGSGNRQPGTVEALFHIVLEDRSVFDKARDVMVSRLH